MAGFAQSAGGTRPDVLVERDLAQVREKEIEFSSANNPNVQKFYREKTPEGVVKKWKENKAESKSGQMEMAMTILLHKLLKDNFLVVRTSEYDDYVNGVDNLILNKETGDVICAFDEVHEGGRGERTEKKIEKIQKKAKKGGAKVNYGVSLAQGKIARASLGNIPVFYLGLRQDELESLLRNLGNPDEAMNDAEFSVFQKLVGSLREQKTMLEGSDLPPVIRGKLIQFEKSLRYLETINKPTVAMAA